MERGDVYFASEKGALTSKPRPVVVVQNDAANRLHTTITICLISTSLSGNGLFRVLVAPTAENGLEHPSEVQIDRLYSFQRDSFDHRLGALSAADMRRIDDALRRWLDL